MPVFGLAAGCKEKSSALFGVNVVYPDDTPVKGVAVQILDGEGAYLVRARAVDERGEVCFDAAEVQRELRGAKKYTVKVSQPPEGYTSEPVEFTPDADGSGQLTVKLQKTL